MTHSAQDTASSNAYAHFVSTAATDLLRELALAKRAHAETAKNYLTPQVLADLRNRTYWVRQAIGAGFAPGTTASSSNYTPSFTEAINAWIEVVGIVNLALLDIYDPDLARLIGEAKGMDAAFLLPENSFFWDVVHGRRRHPADAALEMYARLMHTALRPTAQSDAPSAKRLGDAIRLLATGPRKCGPAGTTDASHWKDLMSALDGVLADMEAQLADFVRANWSPQSAAEAARAAVTPLVLNAGDLHVGDKYTTNITDSNVGASAVGPSARATGSVTVANEPRTQEHHRKAIAEAQGALVHDQDAIDKIDSRLFEALNQFLRLARDIQVEQKGLADLQAKMNGTLDEVWAKQVAKGMKPQLLPKTLEFVGQMVTNPIMTEVAKKLIES